MNTVLGVVKQEYTLENERRISYGIAAYANVESVGTSCVIHSVPDICEDYQKISDFVYLCNDMNVSIIHLDDIISDFLNN